MRRPKLPTPSLKNDFHSFVLAFACFFNPPANFLDRADVSLTVVTANHSYWQQENLRSYSCVELERL